MRLKNENHIRIDGDSLAAELGYRDLWEMRQALAQMSRMEPGELAIEELTDLTEIEVDDSLTLEEQALSLLRQTKNPYFYRYEGMIVMISDSARETLESFLSTCLFRKRGRGV